MFNGMTMIQYSDGDQTSTSPLLIDPKPYRYVCVMGLMGLIPRTKIALKSITLRPFYPFRKLGIF